MVAVCEVPKATLLEDICLSCEVKCVILSCLVLLQGDASYSKSICNHALESTLVDYSPELLTLQALMPL